MCLAIPGQIVSMDAEHPDLAMADVSGVRRRINVGILAEEGIGPGDWVLIHVGFAMAKVDEAEAQASLKLLVDMGQAFIDELEAMRQEV